MRNNRIVIGALSLVLLAGAAIGVWLVLQDDPGPTDTSVAADRDRNDGAGDDRTPIGDTDRTEPADGATRADTETTDADDTTVPDNTHDATAPAGNTDEPTVTDVEAHKDWEENTREILITGKVTFKHDGRPAAGAEVRAVAVDRAEFGPWGSNGDAAPVEDEPDRPEARVSGRTTSDGAGEFSFSLKVTGFATREELKLDPREGLPVGVRVVATMSGYAPASSGSIWLSWTESEKQVELKLALPAALKGRVVDAGTQEGIACAHVALWDLGGNVDERYLTTGEDGRFAIKNLPEGRWTVLIQADGYADWNSEEPLRLEERAERDLGDIALHPTAKIFGRVVDENTGKGIPNVKVSLQSTGRWGAFEPSSATTGEDGKFQMTSVEPGTYTMRADAGGYAPTDVESVRVGSSEQLDVGTIKLGRGLTIRGRVQNENKDAITGAAVEVIVNNSNGTLFGSEETIAKATSESDGAFEISGLNEGDFTLQVKAAGYAEYRESIKVSGDGGEFDVTLSRGGVITGRVLDTDSRPVPGLTCTTVDHKSQEYSLYKLNPEMIGFGLPRHGHETDAAGRFEIALLPEGTYLFAVMDQENNRRILHDDVVVKNDEVTDLGDLRFEAPGNVRVTVTENGQPVPGLKVNLARSVVSFGGRNKLEATTDARGVAIIDDVPPGRWVVQTRRDEPAFDTDTQGRTVTAVSGKTVEFHLELQREDRAHLYGRLTINGVAVLKDVSLVGRGERKGLFKNTTAKDGRYEFLSVKPGRYHLYARETQSSVAARLEVNIEAPGKIEINRDFRGYRVDGRVTTPGGAYELSSASISLTPLGAADSTIDRMLVGRIQVQADGGFEILRVPMGKYLVTATVPGVGTASTTIEVVSGDVAGLSLTVRDDSGSIKISIGELNGEPVSGSSFGMVELTDAQGMPVSMGDKQEGFFMVAKSASVTLSTVAPGRYTVRVLASGYLPVTKQDVVVETGETTEVSVDLTAEAELHLTVTSGEVTQEMLDGATVRYFDAGGQALEVVSNLFDSFGATTTPETPTLIARYLHEKVAEVRIKIDGYLELTIPVQPQPGQKIEKQETLLAE